jgi:hypothetical protein
LKVWDFLKLEVPRYTGNNGKDTYLYSFNLLGSLCGAALLIEKDKIRVEPAVHIINSEYPTAFVFFGAFGLGGIGKTHISTVVGWRSVGVYPAKFLGKHTLNKIEPFGVGGCISGSKYKYAAKFPFFGKIVIGYYAQVVASVVFGRVFLSIVQVGKLSPGPA